MGLNGKYSIGIVITFVLSALAMLYIFPLINFFTGTDNFTSLKFFYTRIALWAVLLMMIFYTVTVEKKTFLLWQEKSYPPVFYILSVMGLYFICLLGGAVLNMLITALSHEKFSDRLFQLSTIFKNNYFLIIFTCLTAGVVEEFLMRGYLQPRIEKIYNSPITGIVVSALLFGILHSTYGTIGQVAIPTFIGIVFAVFYKLYSNIKILIICHFLYDFVSLMIMNFMDIKHLSAL